MKVRIEQIGYARIIRLPKGLLPKARIGDVVELAVEPDRTATHNTTTPRSGWAKAARRMRAQGEDRLYNVLPSTRFDKKDWKWE
jgi:hypothetical protein